jgi:hypothetical protein
MLLEFPDEGLVTVNRIKDRELGKAVLSLAMSQLTTQKAVHRGRLCRNCLIILVGAWGFEPQTPTVSTP